MSENRFKPTLCVDFDGCLHSYASGWQGASRADDPPVQGALEFLFEATKYFKVSIYSSRSKSLRGRACMKRYMREHFAIPLTFSPDHEWDFLHEELHYPWFKPPAFLTIDDRAICFDGDWSKLDPEKLRTFRPWMIA